jgi:hypothetical protein
VLRDVELETPERARCAIISKANPQLNSKPKNIDKKSCYILISYDKHLLTAIVYK